MVVSAAALTVEVVGALAPGVVLSVESAGLLLSLGAACATDAGKTAHAHQTSAIAHAEAVAWPRLRTAQ